MADEMDDEQEGSFGGYLNDQMGEPDPMEQEPRGEMDRMYSAGGTGAHFPAVASGDDFFKWRADMNDSVCPCRVMCVNIKAQYLQPDAKMLLDALTPEDPNQLAHANGQFSLLTMLFAGTGKGFPTGTPPEIAQMQLRGAEAGEIEKAIKAATPYNQYTFTPQRVEQGVMHTSDEHVRGMALGLEYIKNKTKTAYWGIRVWKVVMDPSHSDSSLWAAVMAENQNAYNQTTNHAMPDRLRRTQEAAFAASARSMDDKSNLEESALNAFRWIKTNADLCKVYSLYAGEDEASPLFDDMQNEIGNEEMNRVIMKHEKYGGTHKLGPEHALNPRRGNPLNAGMLYCKEDTDFPCEEQTKLDNYVGPNNELRFPREACDLGEVFFTSNASVRCLMNKPLPIQITSVAKPSDAVLEFWFSTMWQTDPELLEHVDAEEVRANGMSEWRKYEDVCLRGFLRHISGSEYATSTEKLMQGTELRSSASINLTSREKATLAGNDKAAPGKRPRESLVEVGKKISRAIDLVRTYAASATKEIQELKDDGYARNRDRIAQMQREKDQTVATLMRDINKFGIALRSRVFQSKRERSEVAPGILASHDAFVKDLRCFGELINSGVYRLNPQDPRRTAGTANVAFGMGNDLYTDKAESDLIPEARKNAWGVWRRFINVIFTDVLKIEGREVRIAVEVYQQMFEAFANFSTVLNLCGPKGCAKSETLVRLDRIMPGGSFMWAGSRSTKEGLNEGYNPYCAYTRLFHEVPAMFCDKKEEELSKQVVWDNFSYHSRSVKCTSADGTEDFKTKPMYQIRKETYVVPNNHGPMMLTKEDEEPDPSKQALYDRFHVQVCFTSRPPGDEGYANQKEFEDSLSDPKNAKPLAAMRLMIGLIKSVLSYTANVPALQTKTEYANVLFRKFDRMLVHQFGISRPESRRETKRHETLQLICAEAACAEVFFCKQSAANFDFMMPELVVDADEPTPENGIRGHLAIWEDSHLEPAIRRAAMPTMHEIVAAWAAGLYYNEQTSPHFFWVLHNIAEAVGIHASLHDFRTMTNGGQPAHTTPSSSDNPGGASLDPLDDSMQNGDAEEPWDPDLERGVQYPHFVKRRGGICVEDAKERAADMAMQRIARVASLKVGLRVGSKDGDTALQSMRGTWQVAQDSELPEFYDSKMCRVRAMTREEATGYAYPSPYDLLAVGYGAEHLDYWSRGLGASPMNVDPKFGVLLGNYTFHNWQPSNKTPTAAAIDPSWRLMQTTAPDAGKRWLSASRTMLQQASANGAHSAKIFGLTPHIVRDCLYLCSTWEVPVRCPRNSEQRAKYEEAMTKIDRGMPGSVIAGTPTLYDSVSETHLIRPQDTEVFRQNSDCKTAVFGQLANYQQFRRWISQDGDEDEIHGDRGVFAARLDALVNMGRLPAAAPLYSTRVEKSRPIRMGTDNCLLVNTDYFVRHQNLFVEVALDNLRHVSMRSDPYNLTLGKADSAPGQMHGQLSPPTEGDATRHAGPRRNRELLEHIPLHYDMFPLFLTNKAVEMISMDTDAAMGEMNIPPGGVAIPRVTTCFPGADIAKTPLVTIQWSKHGSGGSFEDETHESAAADIERARSAAESLNARALGPEDAAVLAQLKASRRKNALPVAGDPLNFSTWCELLSSPFPVCPLTRAFL